MGFETVTIVYDGEVEHRDSTGAGGVISKGDVQWMTAASGLIHEEKHSKKYAQEGGPFEMVQLWVNLPKKDKSANPGYQGILNADIPQVDLKDGAGKLRVIAGEYNGNKGPAHTFTPINLWDIELQAEGSTTLQIPNLHNVLLLVQEGELLVNGTHVVAGQLIQFVAPSKTRTDLQNENTSIITTDAAVNTDTTDTIELAYPATAEAEKAVAPVKLLLLSGEPIGEPIAGYGPFVMNTQAELKQTFRDYQTGNFGK